MGYSDWVYIGSEDTDGKHIARFEHRQDGRIKEVVLTAEEAKYVTHGEVCERLLRQVGESRWQDEFASMLSNMMKGEVSNGQKA